MVISGFHRELILAIFSLRSDVVILDDRKLWYPITERDSPAPTEFTFSVSCFLTPSFLFTFHFCIQPSRSIPFIFLSRAESVPLGTRGIIEMTAVKRR